MTLPPNVIIILTDDQGFGDFACHGNPVVRTPHLDRLHNESVRLADFHLDPMCAPSRAALMTGRYSARTGVWSTLTGRYILRRDEITMAKVFADAGYRTGLFGKWHLGDTYPYRPQDRGFQEALTFGGGVVGEIPDWWDNDYFNATYLRNGRPEEFLGKYCTDLWFDQAMRFVDSGSDQPFFCCITTNAPHGPFDVHDRYRAPYLSQGVPHDRAGFYGMIENIDENIGRLRRWLAENDLAENTLITFGGDNGTSTGVGVDRKGFRTDGYNAGMRGKKCWAYDGGHRNACLVHWPAGGVTGGRDVGGLTAHIDLLPTLIDLCRLRAPDGLELDGISLRPQLQGDVERAPRRTLFVHNQQLDTPRKNKDLEVMTPEWRLTVTEQWGPGGRELFDVEADPGQTTDVSRGYPAVMRDLMTEYDRWWESVSVQFGDYSNIVVGSGAEPVTKLTCHAWHAGKGLYNQWHVRPGPVDNGFWTIEVEREGVYEISLRRWPVECDAAICAPVPARTGVDYVHDFLKGAALPIVSARVRIGGRQATAPVGPDDRDVQFTMRLSRGPARLETWLNEADGTERGAYYAYVRRLE